MMRTPRPVFAMLLVATLALSPTSAWAADYALSAVQDATIVEQPSDEASRNSTINGNGLEVRITSTGGNNRRNALIQFDLSGVPNDKVFTGARIEYYDLGTSPNQSTGFANDTYFIVPDQTVFDANPSALSYNNSLGNVALSSSGISEANLTYNSLYGVGGAVPGNWDETPQALAASLDLTLPAGNAGGQYYSTGPAASSVLTFLDSANTNVGFAVLMSWRQTGYRIFGDIESGFAPRLILTTSTIGDFDDSGTIDLGDYGVLLSNMQGHLDAGLTAITHGDGDINFDGKVNLDDFGLFKSLYPGGPGALAADLAAVSIPEPSTFVLIGMAGFLALARRRSR